MGSLQRYVQTFPIFPTKKHNRPPVPPSIKLSSLDLVTSPIHIPNHRYYRLSDPSLEKFNTVVDKLKASLAEALELYPPVAGAVDLEDGALVISGNPLGTPFLVEVKSTPFTEDMEDVSPRINPFLPLGSSVLAVKVTKFSCGTIAIASSIHHQTTDLRGYIDFLQLWAQITRGEPVDYAKIPSDWTHNPAQYFPASTTENLQPPPGFMTLPLPTDSDSLPYTMQAATATRWVVTKSSLNQLKKDFSPFTEPDTWISTGDALAALIWGAISRARNSFGIVVPRPNGSNGDSQTETFLATVDCRDRVPKGTMNEGGYFGNFNPLYATVVPRSDLLSPTNEAASRVALYLRNALRAQVDLTFLADKLKFLDESQNSQPPQLIAFDADVIITNWCRVDLQGPKLDFGEGRPFLATAGADAIFPPGFSRWTRDTATGDISMLLTIEEVAAEEMNKDVLLNRYATLVKVH